MLSLKLLRQQIRARRRAIPAPDRHQAAQLMARRVVALKLFMKAHHLAGYLAFDSEIDPLPLLEQAWAMGKAVYLPVLTGNPQTHLAFAPYHADTILQPNRFGILEPTVVSEHLLPPQRLDLVLTPVVAFDASGTRLGMGGGFYDRTFAFLRNPAHLHKPRLLGLAFEFQKVDELIRQPWDIPLDGIVTEAAVHAGADGHWLE